MRKIYWSKNILSLKYKVAKTINYLIHYKTLKQGFRNSMAPRFLSKKDSGYESVKELDYAIGRKDCFNIALTGIYGSGKSSIIKTVLKKHRWKNVLRLSLSRYISKEENINFNEQEIERTIFQHVLYKSNPNHTPQSKYRRISHRNYKKAVFYSFCVIVIALCGVILWRSEWIDGLGLKPPFIGTALQELMLKVAEWKNSLAVTCLFVAALVVLTHVIRRASKFGIHSIKIKDVEFDVKDKDVDFNTLIDELLYYLKAGNYDMVVFEDLDRIDKPKQLFLKFREINLLLNESAYYKFWHKRIVFLYAIRDEVFQEEEKTKFFDYIVPVIPVVDHFNTSDYLLKNYKPELDEVDDKDIMSLGLYIGGMRQLLNIMNEYGVYKRMILVKPLSQTKLLALTIYKNLYPKDYAEAHNKQGSLYNVFENKKKFSVLLTANDEKVLENLNKQIEVTKRDIIEQRKILTIWAQMKGNITALIINEERHGLDEVIARDDLFHQVETNNVDGIVEEEEGHEYRRTWNYKFNEIVREMDENGNYSETMYELNEKLFKLVVSRNTVQKKIQVITNYALQKIILEIDDTGKTLEIVTKQCGNDKEKARVLHAFIRNGYIDDDYKAYLTFSYPGSMSRIDFEFVHSVLQGSETDYYVELNSFDQIIKSLHTDNFSHKSILNYSLLKYLLAQKDEVRLDLFIQTAKNEPSFMVSAYQYEEVDEEFFRRVFEGWNYCIREILKLVLASDQKTMLMLFWREAPQGLLLDDSERAYLNGMYNVVCESISVITQESAIKTADAYNLIFERIRKPDDATKDLYEYVLEHHQFSINAENLSIIYGESFNTSSYTQVMNGKKSVYEYVNENIEEFMRLLPETDTQESENAIVEIINKKLIDRELVKQFVSRQEKKLDSLDKVNAVSYGFLFETDRIIPSWGVIEKYYSTCPNDTEQVVEYVKRHVDELENSKSEEKDMGLPMLLLKDNETLTSEQYEKLAKCFDLYFNTSDLANLDDERLKAVVNNDLVEYNKESVDFFKGESEELLAHFIIHFFGEIVKDENFDVSFNNELSLRLLNSELTIEQKKWLIDTQIIMNDGADKQELAKLVCYYTKEAGVDRDTNVNFVVEAMETYTDEAGWKVKIDLINDVNGTFTYNSGREERMLNALGGGYRELNSLGGNPITFDNREENRTLLNYLKEKEHNVNKVKPGENGIKVTFKKKKQIRESSKANTITSV